MPYCLPKSFAQKIKESIISGKLNPEKLNNMTSAQRRTFLSELVGAENAKQVNLLFEKKLLLKNQERAITDWAREITGMSAEAKATTLEKIRQTYADKKRRLENPKENEQFLNEITSDVYSKKFKTEVSLEEAQTITELSADVQNSRAKMNEDFTFDSPKEALDFGASKVAFDNYVGGLKTEAQTRRIIPSLKPSALAENAKIAFNFIADNSRAMKASFDNSFWGRQGIRVMFNPRFSKIWAKNFAKSFTDINKTLRGGSKAGDAIIDATKAEIYSRENFLKGRYDRPGATKLDVGIREEEFPTSAPSKIPALGRLFKAAETAYEAGAMRMRADIADKFYKLAEKNGVDLSDKFVTGSINELVNSMTGRGKLGRFESVAPLVNKAFFSIKKVKADLDFLTLHAGSKLHPFARKQAAMNLLSVASTMAIVLGVAKELDPNSVDFDPRSANFGKIKIGDTRFDITGGSTSLAILASRIATQSTKSSVTGKVTKLGEGFGSPTGMDTFWQFTENKFSPMFSQIKEIAEQETFAGDKPTPLSVVKGLTVPIILEEGATASQNEKSANLALILIAEGLGISANTYSINTNWEQSTSKELKGLKQKIGQKRFKQANDRFNKAMRNWFAVVQKTKKYKDLSDDEKGKLITDKRKEVKDRVFKQYHFVK